MKKYFIYYKGKRVNNKHFPTNKHGYSSEQSAYSAIRNIENWLNFGICNNQQEFVNEFHPEKIERTSYYNLYNTFKIKSK